MADVIVDSGNGHSYVYPYIPDFCYILNRGTSERWAFLLAYPNDFDTDDEFPAVFLSTDGGLSYALQDAAGAPVANKTGLISVAYDARFNQLNPSSQTKITILYAEQPVTAAMTLHLVDFDLDAKTYGSPYGSVTLASFMVDHCFSSRPDGAAILLYNRQGVNGTFYRIRSGGSWSGETTLTGALSRIANALVDTSNNTHVFLSSGSYYRLDSSGAIVEGPTAALPTMNSGNLVLIGTSLYLPFFDGTNIRLATGTPVATPAWTTEIVASQTLARGFPQEVWFASLSGAYAIGLELNESLDYTIDSQGYSATGFTLHWFSADRHSIYRSVKSGGSWSTPAVIWTASTPGDTFSLIARGTAAQSGARYRPIF